MTTNWIVIAFTTCIQFFIFLRWLHRRMRDDEIRRTFIRDMALNHLPHLYHAMRQIAAHLGLEIEEPPPVRFLEFNGHGKGAEIRES